MNTIDHASYDDLFVTARDGLVLHVRDYGRHGATALPVVCLPGLTRTAADFGDLAVALACDPTLPRRVLAVDYRGRGLSAWDPDPDNYTVATELDDVLAILAACEATPAVFVGSSRGGLITMALAGVRPCAIAGVVLNDIGPVIEIDGLMRIKNRVGRMPPPADFSAAAEQLRHTHGAAFPRLTTAEWLAWAERAWTRKNGTLVTTYDPALARSLDDVAADQPIPTLWPQFDALADVPLMIVRGANSDLLSAATVAAMQARRRETTVLEVPDQGHTPLLADTDTIAAITTFVRHCDARRHDP